MGLSTEPRIINVRPKQPRKPESPIQRMRRLQAEAAFERRAMEMEQRTPREELDKISDLFGDFS